MDISTIPTSVSQVCTLGALCWTDIDAGFGLWFAGMIALVVSGAGVWAMDRPRRQRREELVHFVATCDRVVVRLDQAAQPIVLAIRHPDDYLPQKALELSRSVKSNNDLRMISKMLDMPIDVWPDPSLRHALKLLFEVTTLLLVRYDLLMADIYSPDPRKVRSAIRLYEEALGEYKLASDSTINRNVLMRAVQQWRRHTRLLPQRPDRRVGRAKISVGPRRFGKERRAPSIPSVSNS